MARALVVTIGMLGYILLVPYAAAAQRGNATLTGVVRDGSGAVLPGVTVKASSPALIEKTRAVVTDSSGQYRIVDLRPGVYDVSFMLPGFKTVKREALQLNADFTATVNAEMAVGKLEETITVRGESPIVDVQNVVQQRNLTREVLDAVPTGKYYQSLGSLIPGVVLNAGNGATNLDVGGSLGNQNVTMSIHGGRSRDQQVFVDGLNITIMTRNDTTVMLLQDGNIEEIGLKVGVNPAENETGGVLVNLIPKDGGNTFRGRFFGNFTHGALQVSNLDDDLRARGLTAANRAKRLYDINPALGGPIAADRLWFYAAYRHMLNEQYIAGTVYNKDPKSWVYEPDYSREEPFWDQRNRDANLRLTWQASPRNKFTAYSRLIQTRIRRRPLGGQVRSAAGLRGAWLPSHSCARTPSGSQPRVV